MKRFTRRSAPFVIAILVIAGLLLVYFLIIRPLSDVPQEKYRKTSGIGTLDVKNDASAQAALAFSNEFKTVEKSSVDGDIEFFLWEAAMSEDNSDAEALVQPADSSLIQLAETFKQLVASKGVHYIERSSALGMDMYTEYWISDGKFKMLEKTINQMTLFDGKYYYLIKLDEKTGQRSSTDNALVSVEVQGKVNGILSKLAYTGYSQEPDQKVGDFDCNVFHSDMEVMGIKGNWQYVDKKTGMLVKSVYGEGENAMTTEITEYQQGGFGDEVFKVPTGITID